MAGKLLLFAAALLAMAIPGRSHNITTILAAFPEYSVYNDYLSRTKVADEINTRETITVLVLPNAAMTALAGTRPLAAVKAALRLLTVLDYYDAKKLHQLSEGSVLTTTLLQTTGAAPGNLGFINITDLSGGRVGFGSTYPGSKLASVYTKSVKQLPYGISVIEISEPIVFPGLLDAPTRTSNLTAILVKAGCETFASLISSSGVIKIYQGFVDSGLTIFAPNDEAFTKEGSPDLSVLSSAETVSLLQYHAAPVYRPKASLAAAKGPVATLASSGAGKFEFSVKTSGDEVSLVTGVDTSRVANTIVDDPPFCVMTVDSVLMPEEIFALAPAPAPGPAVPEPTAAPEPSPETPAPAPSKKKKKTPASAPAEEPAASPDNKPADTTADKSFAVPALPPAHRAAVAVAAAAAVLLCV